MNLEPVSVNTSFKGKEKLSHADNFLKSSDKLTKKQQEGDFFSRTMWSNTALIPIGLGVIGYEIYGFRKLSKLEKAKNLVEHDAFKKAFKKRLPIVFVAGVALIAGLQYLFNQNSDKKYEKIKKTFNEINTETSAIIHDKPFVSSSLGASFNPISGKVAINRNMVNDPITNRDCKKLLKHELVHARQYETIVRMENGIEKLNYAVLKRIATIADKPFIKEEFINIYVDIQADSSKYENRTIYIDNAPVNFKDYITAIYTLLTNKEATYNDIPMVINKEHYEKVREQKGKLTPEETQKAELYYQAQLDYPQINMFQIINPFSKYRNNLLEVEAYKENPGFYGFIRKIFGKS